LLLGIFASNTRIMALLIKITKFVPMVDERSGLFWIVWVNLFDMLGNRLVPNLACGSWHTIQNTCTQLVVGKAPITVEQF